MTKVKICGITHLDDAMACVKSGADMLGFVFYKKSPRYISPKKAKEIIAELPQDIEKVALFVNEEKKTVAGILRDIEKIDILQFHGEETGEYCDSFNKMTIKAIRVSDDQSLDKIQQYPRVNFILLDSYNKDVYGGTGLRFDWTLAKSAKRYNKPIILSGGLNASNVSDAIKFLKPYAVDVSSGVEISAGRKDYELIAEFIKNAKTKIR